MTQAKNVALGVSNFNSSGVLQPAGGGTGLSSPGTSGNVLTSTGTGWTSTALPPQFPSGTALVFKQTSAPTGWTKVTTDNDAALRVVSGSASTGGSVGFTTAFASQAVSGTVGTSGSTTATNQNTTAGGSVATTGATTVTGTVGGTTLSAAQMPSHTHFVANYQSQVGWSGNSPGNVFSNNLNFNNIGGVNSGGAGSSGSHDHSFSGGSHTHTSGAFTGTAHTHTQDAHTHTGGTFTGTAINLAVKYVDVIVATKD